ncbi:2OG-Fe(II) oxygenase [Paracraurococcus lichenis]|uniref:2OG-Fe(II) oxygenase n=1 Tax=Paracraurococcus lichenis TaxID=3064888 RepID=A0ABT9E2F1_9PROT|nr:2OG-Fe(II) oxygenase [Paracraurococcus sp. LOR1-02]MDO9710324.1 2OG-Fe(II) oxygenase [Paracraurococcus sp. LOR1-02]
MTATRPAEAGLGSMPKTEDFDATVRRMVPFARLVAEREALRARFLAGKPYSNLVLDGYFQEDILDRVAADFPKETPRDWIGYDTKDEIKRTSRGLVGVPPFAQAFLWQLCSEPFLEILRDITGIEDLVADPLFHGGGLHESFRGGWLNIHADWTQHPHLPLVRRLNLIVYLNRDWDADWGGALELWGSKEGPAGARIEPFFNRAALFPTTEETLHGFPTPMTCPVGRSRKSVSIFYWAPDPEQIERGAPITFLPGTRETRAKAFMRSLVPPIAFQMRDYARGLLRKA